MLSLQIKNFFKICVAVNNSFRLFDAVSNVESNLEIFSEMGKVSSNVVQFLIRGYRRDSVKLENLSR